MARVLALDVGTSSVRAQVLEADATPVEDAEARHEYPDETDPDRIAALARGTLEQARRGVTVDAVAASCFGHSLVALDAGGQGTVHSPCEGFLASEAS